MSVIFVVTYKLEYEVYLVFDMLHKDMTFFMLNSHKENFSQLLPMFYTCTSRFQRDQTLIGGKAR